MAETHTNSAMFQVGIISSEEQERARKAFKMSFQGTELKELNSRNPKKDNFSSQKYIKGLSSSTSLRVGHSGTPPWPPQKAKAFLLQGSNDSYQSIQAAVPWLLHLSQFPVLHSPAELPSCFHYTSLIR